MGSSRRSERRSTAFGRSTTCTPSSRGACHARDPGGPGDARLPRGPGGAVERREARARRSRCTWRSSRRDDQLRVEIDDDGEGFDSARPASSCRAGRVGLASMRERVELASGTFVVRSSHGRGTTIVATLPIERRRRRGDLLSRRRVGGPGARRGCPLATDVGLRVGARVGLRRTVGSRLSVGLGDGAGMGSATSLGGGLARGAGSPGSVRRGRRRGRTAAAWARRTGARRRPSV